MTLPYTAKTWDPDSILYNTDVNDISSALGDITVDSGWLESGILYYRQIGPVVYVKWYRNTNINAGATVVVGTLPAGYRPSGTQAVSCSRALQDGYIATDGTVNITNSDSVGRNHFGSANFVLG